MPNIREFTSPINRLEPTSMGSQAREIEGRHIGADLDIAGRYVGGAVEKLGSAWEQGVTESEIAQVNQLNSDQMAALDKSKADAFSKADPNDPNVAENWRKSGLEESLSEFDARTADMTPAARRLAQQHISNLRQMFTREAHADQANLAAIGAVNSLKDTGEFFTQRVNGANIDDTVEAWNTTIGAVLENPNLTPEARAKIGEEFGDKTRHNIIANGLTAQITSNPKQFMDDLNSGKLDKYNLTAEDKEKLGNVATRVSNALDRAGEHEAEQAQKAARHLADTTLDTYLQNVPIDADGNPRPDQAWLKNVLADKNLDREARSQALEVFGRWAVKPEKPAVKPNPTLNNLTQRAGDGTLTDAELRSHVGVDISTAEYTFLKGLSNGSKVAAGQTQNRIITTNLATARQIINARLGSNNEQSALAYKAVADWYMERVNAARNPNVKNMLADPTKHIMMLNDDLQGLIDTVTHTDSKGNRVGGTPDITEQLRRNAQQAGITPPPAALPSQSGDVRARMNAIAGGQ